MDAEQRSIAWGVHFPAEILESEPTEAQLEVSYMTAGRLVTPGKIEWAQKNTFSEYKSAGIDGNFVGKPNIKMPTNYLKASSS